MFDYTDFKERFPEDWQRDAESILEAAKVLTDAKGELHKKRFKELAAALGLNEKTRQRLTKIGSRKQLYQKRIRPKLPNSYATIEKIAGLSASELDEAIQKNLINKDTSRADVERLLSSGDKIEKQDWSGTRPVITIRVDADVKDYDYVKKLMDSVKQTIDMLRENENMVSVHAQDHGYLDILEAKEERRHSAEWSKTIREALKWGKRLVRDELSRRRKKTPDWKKKSAKAHHTPLFWNEEEYTKITSMAQLEAALSELGFDFETHAPDKFIDDVKRTLEQRDRLKHG